MPTITVRYTDQSSQTIVGTSIAVVAVPAADYRHDDKPVDRIVFALGTASSCAVHVSSAGGAFPAQTCFSGAAPSQGLPFAAAWTMPSASVGVLTLSIPTTGTTTYPARLEVVGGGNIDISVRH